VSAPNILFLTLRVFSATGGIEKVCRVAGKALYEAGLKDGWTMKIASLHGSQSAKTGNRYFPQTAIQGFSSQRIRFVLNSLVTGRKSRVVLLSHINLLVVGWLIKKLKPSVKLVMLAHGIEVWKDFPYWKKQMLRTCDLILPVSHYTRDRMIRLHQLNPEKLVVINNCLDPFLERPLTAGKNKALLDHYGLAGTNQVLLTVSRMVETERYKGYDKVIESLPSLISHYPDLRYMMVGRYDEQEKKRLDALIDDLGLTPYVIFTNIIPDEVLAAHFSLADVFVMPSEKEGFGIVFIEAMFYGIPVIAGNKDGSVDALCNGELGILVDPDNREELVKAIETVLENPGDRQPDREKLMKQFSYRSYKKKITGIMNGFLVTAASYSDLAVGQV